MTYRIIPNKRAGRGDKVGGARLLCALKCASPPSTLTQPLVRAGSRCVNKGCSLLSPVTETRCYRTLESVSAASVSPMLAQRCLGWTDIGTAVATL